LDCDSVRCESTQAKANCVSVEQQPKPERYWQGCCFQPATDCYSPSLECPSSAAVVEAATDQAVTVVRLSSLASSGRGARSPPLPTLSVSRTACITPPPSLPSGMVQEGA
jgi:hypothetical protein